MIRQTVALLLDAYRDLNARKLFWVTLILSAVFVGVFACFGADAKGFNILRWHFDMSRHDAEIVFKSIFRTAVIGFWLTWVATILALISTAGIFPDFITGGSIDLYLSKPLSRARLFIVKYFSGLLFVALQVVVVAVGGFLVLGIRGHQWMPSIFWAIPIVICFFSYLFGICVFFGVSTRSTIAALLLTLLFWGLFAGLDIAERPLLMMRNTFENQASKPVVIAGDAEAQKEHDSVERNVWLFRMMHRTAYVFKTVTPKTSDTIELLDRVIFTESDLTTGLDEQRERARSRGREGPTPFGTDPDATVAGAKQTFHEIWSRSPAWVIGTSLAFEFVIVLWAGWLFCRRDY
jgi:hypothetical protein